ncbi:PrgH/EprH family type III secretion apparatus protein [Burkholderia dolosa]|uniref:PrgH/EprH family type III secretion apparatus protein n=1 Tax=Burkholderia dolosa TaxID=152500 RepID=UPI001592AD78|nr:PrgH/EprH family type III secretion apparatus protein [Burkholderia dolosa]
MEKISPDLPALTLRILFGPLFGVDISISGQETLFIVGDPILHSPPDSAEHALNLSSDAIYIPCVNSKFSFRIRHDSHSTPRTNASPNIETDEISVEFIGVESGSIQTRTVPFNSVCQFGGIAFAVKSSDAVWSEAIATYSGVPTETNTDTSKPHRGARCVGRMVAWWIAFLVGTLAIASAGVIWFAKRQAPAHPVSGHSEPAMPRPAPRITPAGLARVTGLLARAPVINTVLTGTDGKLYVLSGSREGADWNREALRNLSAPAVTIVTVEEERRRLESRLDDAGIDSVTLRLDTPADPQLIMDRKFGPDLPERARNVLIAAAPYVRSVRIAEVARESIDRDARDALDTLGLSYRALARQSGTTFEIQFPGDAELIPLQSLIHTFSERWGIRRVSFRIAPHSTRLNGKSYLDGEHSYVLLNPTSWYFPPPVSGALLR